VRLHNVQVDAGRDPPPAAVAASVTAAEAARRDAAFASSSSGSGSGGGDGSGSGFTGRSSAERRAADDAVLAAAEETRMRAGYAALTAQLRAQKATQGGVAVGSSPWKRPALVDDGNDGGDGDNDNGGGGGGGGGCGGGGSGDGHEYGNEDEDMGMSGAGVGAGGGNLTLPAPAAASATKAKKQKRRGAAVAGDGGVAEPAEPGAQAPKDPNSGDQPAASSPLLSSMVSTLLSSPGERRRRRIARDSTFVSEDDAMKEAMRRSMLDAQQAMADEPPTEAAPMSDAAMSEATPAKATLAKGSAKRGGKAAKATAKAAPSASFLSSSASSSSSSSSMPSPSPPHPVQTAPHPVPTAPTSLGAAMFPGFGNGRRASQRASSGGFSAEALAEGLRRWSAPAPWRVVWSERQGKPFFVHGGSNKGQWKVPPGARPKSDGGQDGSGCNDGGNGSNGGGENDGGGSGGGVVGSDNYGDSGILTDENYDHVDPASGGRGAEVVAAAGAAVGAAAETAPGLGAGGGTYFNTGVAPAATALLPLGAPRRLFAVGDEVVVLGRHWPGINKHGGPARVERVHPNGARDSERCTAYCTPVAKN